MQRFRIAEQEIKERALPVEIERQVPAREQQQSATFRADAGRPGFSHHRRPALLASVDAILGGDRVRDITGGGREGEALAVGQAVVGADGLGDDAGVSRAFGQDIERARLPARLPPARPPR